MPKNISLRNRIRSCLPFKGRILFSVKGEKVNEKEKSVLFGLVLGVLLVLLLVTANISQLSSGKTEVLGAKPKYQDEIAYWDEFLAKHPNYLDGWIELARLEHE